MNAAFAPTMFSAAERAGLEDFWTVYDGSFDRINTAMMSAVAERPALAALVASTTEEQRAAQSADSKARLRRALDGHWDEYEDRLRADGTAYAKMGLEYVEWCILMRVVSRVCTPLMIEAFAHDAARLARGLSAMQAFFDWALAILADAYLAAKQELLIASERDRRAQELASRLKSEFLANMSHELRTPLNAIIGFAEILHDGEVTPDMPEHKEFLGDILASGKHLLGLINDVLDLAKVEAGKLVLHPGATSLPVVVNEVTSILRTTASQRGARLETEIGDDLGELFLDASRLKQVLYNYVSNAIKFTGEHGVVTIRARDEGATFRIEVSDTGKGIPAAQLPLLFREFEQLESGVAKEHGGTGLGLALTRRLVEAQGGTVGVTSEVGRGSTFFAVLPKRTTTGTVAPQPRTIPPPTAGARTILVVEDDERDQEIIVKTLVDAGFGVETASTAAQALERCRARTYDGVTLDLLLPDASGLDVLRALRSDERTRSVPVFVVTVVAERGAVAGHKVNDVLAKPVEHDVLLACLARAGLTPRAEEEVLVVDDDPGSLKLMTVALTQLGYTGMCFERAHAALELAAKKPPRAVVLDLLMPEMDGFEFLERFRTLPGCRSTPVVVWTTKDLTHDELRQIHSNAQAVVHKGSRFAILEELRAFLGAPAEAEGRAS